MHGRTVRRLTRRRRRSLVGAAPEAEVPPRNADLDVLLENGAPLVVADAVVPARPPAGALAEEPAFEVVQPANGVFVK